MPAARAERIPFAESSTAAQRRGLDAEPSRRLEVDVGRRLAVVDLLRRHGRSKAIARCPASSSTVSITSRFDDEARPSGHFAASRSTASTAPATSGSDSWYRASSRSHDLGVDLLRRLGETDHVVHVPGPLGRAHPHHVRLGAVVPAAAALARELLADLVPELLRVDQHAVHVQNDGGDVACTPYITRRDSRVRDRRGRGLARPVRARRPRRRRTCGPPLHIRPRAGTRSRPARPPAAARL